MLNPDCLQGMEFANKFLDDYRKIESLGFKRAEILRMLGSQDYVIDFIETPDFFASAKKLPKGYKWTDGEKYQYKAGKHSLSETYVFLIIESDIYIKGFYSTWNCQAVVKSSKYADGFEVKFFSSQEYKNKICVIKNWKTMKPQYVLGKLDKVSTFFENSLTNFYAKNGGNLSMQDGMTVDEIAEMLKEKGLVADE